MLGTRLGHGQFTCFTVDVGLCRLLMKKVLYLQLTGFFSLGWPDTSEVLKGGRESCGRLDSPDYLTSR